MRFRQVIFVRHGLQSMRLRNSASLIDLESVRIFKLAGLRECLPQPISPMPGKKIRKATFDLERYTLPRIGAPGNNRHRRGPPTPLSLLSAALRIVCYRCKYVKRAKNFVAIRCSALAINYR